MVSFCLQFTQGNVANNNSVDEFITNLMVFPLDVELVSDSIYSSSNSLDGRRLANEFVSRRKLAEKGQIPQGAITSASANAGSSKAPEQDDGWTIQPEKRKPGWVEAATKKPAAKEEPPATYKMTATKKKAKK